MDGNIWFDGSCLKRNSAPEHWIFLLPVSGSFCLHSQSDGMRAVLWRKPPRLSTSYLFRGLNRCYGGSDLLSSLATPCTHTHLQRHTVPDGCPPAHIKQTVMRRKKNLVTALHRQLSPAAPVSFNCAYRQAGGHAVAKEVAVSMQELAGKHPQSWSKRLEAAGVDLKLHLYLFMYAAPQNARRGNYSRICDTFWRREIVAGPEHRLGTSLPALWRKGKYWSY